MKLKIFHQFSRPWNSFSTTRIRLHVLSALGDQQMYRESIIT